MINRTNWKNGIITRRADGSYVVPYRGYPAYHVPNDGEFAALWAEIDAYAAGRPEQVADEPAPPAPTLEEAKAAKIAAIDAETSSAILAGFDYEMDAGTGTPEALHFSYDSFDQQNFTDSASVAIMAQSGAKGLPASVTWNAYRGWTPESGGELVRLTLDPVEFLALYTGGALSHKAAKMEEGGRRKAAVADAASAEELSGI